MSKTVLVVDDEQDIVELLRYNLEKEGYSVVTAHDGTAALAAADQSIDLVVLDVMMPGVDGFEVCRRLRAMPRHATTPIMFLTARATEFDQVLGLELGADDYVQKPISPRVFVARVRSILRRSNDTARVESIVMPEILRVGDLEINRQNYTVKVDGVETFFPKKEFELLAFLVSNPGRVFSREALLGRIWGENVYVLDRTVDVHVSKVREKLGRHGSKIETVKGVGYRFRD